MDAPDNLVVGDTYAVGGLEYEVLSIGSGAVKYYVQLIGIESIKVTYDKLATETRDRLIVEDWRYPSREGVWVREDGAYRKLINSSDYVEIETPEETAPLYYEIAGDWDSSVTPPDDLDGAETIIDPLLYTISGDWEYV